MKKPDIPDGRDQRFAGAVRTVLQIITGRRQNRIDPPEVSLMSAAGANPTKAEFDQLARSHAQLQRTVAALLRRLDE